MTMGGVKKDRKEFKVVVDVELGPEVHERLAKAIQKAVLMELADVDVAGGYSVVFQGDDLREIVGGRTDGIAIASRTASA